MSKKKELGNPRASRGAGTDRAKAEPTEETSAAAGVIRDYLRGNGYDHRESVDDSANVVFEGKKCVECDILNVIDWTIIVGDGCVQSYFTLPTCVGQDRRTAVSEYCSLVTAPLRFGKLVLNDEGEVAFYVSVPASAICNGNPEVEVDRLLGLSAEIMRLFTDGIVQVLLGRDPGDAFRDCDSRARALEAGGGATPKEGGDALAFLRKGCPDMSGGEESEDADATWRHGDVTASGPTPNYSLEGMNVQGDVPLSKIVAAVRRFRDGNAKGEDAPRLSILLSGPSGVGKSEFVKFLVHEVGAEVMRISASDVLGPLVGQTERRIAYLFQTARETGRVLFLDECDSLLSRRSNASVGWEVTQVNELLQQMECCGVVIAATNFEANLDPAVIRRFTIKVRLDYLDADGKLAFYSRYFATPPLTEGQRRRLEAIPDLTPGDYRTVRQKLYYLSERPDNEARLAALEAESAAKADRRARIGF